MVAGFVPGGDICQRLKTFFGHYNHGGVGGDISIQWVEAGDSAGHPTMEG